MRIIKLVFIIFCTTFSTKCRSPRIADYLILVEELTFFRYLMNYNLMYHLMNFHDPFSQTNAFLLFDGGVIHSIWHLLFSCPNEDNNSLLYLVNILSDFF